MRECKELGLKIWFSIEIGIASSQKNEIKSEKYINEMDDILNKFE